jgi:hypothetical protein
MTLDKQLGSLTFATPKMVSDSFVMQSYSYNAYLGLRILSYGICKNTKKRCEGGKFNNITSKTRQYGGFCYVAQKSKYPDQESKLSS